METKMNHDSLDPRMVFRYAAAGLMLLLPAVFYANFIDVFNLPKVTLFRLAVLVMAASALYELLRTRTFVIRKSLLDLPVAVFFTAAVLATVFSINPFQSVFGQHMYHFDGLIAQASYVLFFFLLTSRCTAEDMNRLLRLVVYGSAPVILYGILQSFGIDFINWQSSSANRVWSSLGNPNFLAGYLVMALPLVLGYALSERGIRRTGAFIVAGAGAWCLLFTFSRAGIIGFTAGMITFMFLAGSSSLKKWLAIVLCAFALLGVTLAATRLMARHDTESLKASSSPLARIQRTLSSRIDVQDPSIKARAGYMKVAVRMALERPVLGYGPDTYAVIWRRYMTRDLVPLMGNRLGNPAYPHNEILQVLASGGIVGLGAYLWLIITAFGRGRDMRRKEGGKYIAAGVIASLTGVLVNNQFSFHTPATAVLFWFLLAFIAVESGLKEREVKMPDAAAFAAAIAGSFMILLAGVFTVRAYAAEIYFPKGLFFEGKGLLDRSLADYRHAVALNPQEQTYYQNLGKMYLTMAEIVSDPAQKRAFLEGSIKTYQKHLSLVPQDALSWNGLGIAYINLQIVTGVPRYLADAEQALRLAIREAPVFLEPYINLGSVLYMKGDKQGALDTYRAALDLNPREALIYFNMGNMYAQEGNLPKAIACWQDALDLNPNYADARANIDDARRQLKERK